MESTNSDLLKENFSELIINQSEVTIRGSVWHKETSEYAEILFLRNPPNIITCIFPKDFTQLQFVKDITSETVVEVNGIINPPSFRTFQPFEVHCNNIKLLSNISAPIDEVQREMIPSIRFLFIRKPSIQFLLHIKGKIRRYFSDYIEHQGFKLFETPILTSFKHGPRRAFKAIISRRSDMSEKDKYLSQTAQFYLEAMAHAFEKVYTIAPAFRADHHESNLGLAEFWMMEVEALYMNFKETLELLEQLLESLCKRLLKEDQDLFLSLIQHRLLDSFKPEFKVHQLEPEFWNMVETEYKIQQEFLLNIKAPFQKLNYFEVVDYLKSKGEYFNGSHVRERLGKLITAKYKKPVFISHWPFTKRRFYAKKCIDAECSQCKESDPVCTHTFDLIAPGGYGEISSGGEREFHEKLLINQIKEKKLRKENNLTLDWYTKFQRFGSLPHAGFSIGLERLTAWLTKTEHINETIAFPRRKIGTDIYY
ncbi:MAG: amino acid--tRNA ligase-related protein [Candidatus Hodarchaeales archaeon]|jgi:asparaginyl-tRNA synthetase